MKLTKVKVDDLKETGIADWFSPANGGCGGSATGSCGCCNNN